ncbi:histidinol-phosphatase [Thiovibrio sp. JS02]
MHTRLCHHAKGEMEEYVLAAVGNGLKEIIFLEHLECGIRYFESTWLSADDFAFYHAEGCRLRERYKGKIRIGLGVEVGYNPKAVPELLGFLRQYRWDRVGVSFHFFEIAGRHYNVVSRKPYNLEALAAHGIEKVISGYFSALLEAITLLPGTVLCHLDAVLRHHPDTRFSEAHHDKIREVLRAMREKGMALEVNTSGFSLRGAPYPAGWIVEDAERLGIPLLAGSDAHKPSDVGRFFAQLASRPS